MSISAGIREKMRTMFGVVRWQPFDTCTEEGRNRERYRRVVLTALASALGKAVGIGTAMVMVPLTLSYLGNERYGLWMTMSSLVLMLGFTDFGLGNGLVNAISEAHGRDDRGLAVRSVSSAFFMLCGIALILGIAGVAVFPWIPWARVFNVTHASAAAESSPALAVLALCFLVSLPLGVVPRIQSGYQEGFRNSAWQAAGSIGGLVAALIAIKVKAGLPWLVGAVAVPPIVATAVNGCVLFGITRPWLRPTWDAVTTARSLSLLRVGGMFFVLQQAAVVTFASDAVVIAHVCGASSVPEYTVPMRLFSIAPMMVSMAMAPLWPAYGEALARGDTPWLRKTLVHSLAVTVAITGSASLLLVMAGHGILRLWVGPAVAVSSALLLGMGLWTVLSNVGESVATLLNGTNSIRFQAVTASVTCLAALAAKIAFGRWFGLVGVVFGTLAAYGACTALPMAFYVPRVMARLSSRARTTDTQYTPFRES